AEHPDLAWRLLVTDGDMNHDSALAQIITSVADRSPARAAAWALPRLGQFEDARQAFNARLALSIALISTNPEQARVLYRQSCDYVLAHTDDDAIMSASRP